MYFTSGSDRAFEQLMQGKPGFDHYDSGEAVTPEDCGTCRFYRPHWKYQFCVYAECPYQPGKLTAYDAVTFRVKGVENMAVFRVERNKGYTVMSNHHLRNKDLSLKAKGLLSQMLSLPENWDYTLKGLSLINRESIDAIRTAVWELEKAGYITRQQNRDGKGKMADMIYTIYEQPQPRPEQPDKAAPGLENPVLENPTSDNPTPGKPTLGNPTQLNKDISSK
ncbi:MAG: helix-turn-helix domain-containing protein, partial [Oscillospiraceae bacterium]|nr:helix-turn-helix domain-containing protein [Oscillospiraceae bacterium]